MSDQLEINYIPESPININQKVTTTISSNKVKCISAFIDNRTPPVMIYITLGYLDNNDNIIKTQRFQIEGPLQQQPVIDKLKDLQNDTVQYLISTGKLPSGTINLDP